jgi:hypothetical protein
MVDAGKVAASQSTVAQVHQERFSTGKKISCLINCCSD